MSASPPTATGVKILVADDSQNDRAVARSVLETAGYTVVEASDGQQALEVFRRERPTLVMIDVVMPRIGGLEACRLLKAQTGRYLPVLMVSSRNAVQDRVSGLRSGADDFIGKPYDPEELQARIEVLLRTQAAFAGQIPNAPPLVSLDADEELEPRAVAEAFGHGERAHTPMSEAAFHKRMAEVFAEAERDSDPLACLRVELDNPPWGKDPVDIALRTEVIHGVIAGSIRKIDLINPRGEMGFILLLPNTHFPGALTVAERVAREVRRRSRARGRGFTVSIGISFYPNRDTRDLEDMLGLVEAALDRARDEGGGKICLFQHQGYLYAPED